MATQTHHQVQTGQLLLSGAKQFAQQSLYPVAINCEMFNFPRDYQPQSWINKIVGFSKNLEKFAGGGTSEPEDGRKLFRVMQPVAFRQKTNNTDPLEVLKFFGQVKPKLPSVRGPWHDGPE